MQKKISYLFCFALVLIIASCDSDKDKTTKAPKEPEAVVTQAISNDTVITYYYGVSPYKLHQQVKTQIEFVRDLKDSTGRFYLTEVYLNRKDSVTQRYDGAGNYKILPKPNGEIQGVALYNMVLDDRSKGYVYLLKDSVTMVRVDDKGKEVKGEDAITLKSTNKKYI